MVIICLTLAISQTVEDVDSKLGEQMVDHRKGI